MHSFNLPLFPLNSVLFPGVPIFLHIFEERYRTMINLCIDNRQPFGVVLIDEGVEAFGEARPVQVGCSAEIVQVERLENDRLNIVAIGRDRFRILTTKTENVYLEGEVEHFPLALPESNLFLNRMCSGLTDDLEGYIERLRKVSDLQISWEELPDDPVELAWLAAYVLQVSGEDKQQFLKTASALEMIQDIRHTCQIETKLLDCLISQTKVQQNIGGTTFSLN